VWFWFWVVLFTHEKGSCFLYGFRGLGSPAQPMLLVSQSFYVIIDDWKFLHQRYCICINYLPIILGSCWERIFNNNDCHIFSGPVYWEGVSERWKENPETIVSGNSSSNAVILKSSDYRLGTWLIWGRCLTTTRLWVQSPVLQTRTNEENSDYYGKCCGSEFYVYVCSSHGVVVRTQSWVYRWGSLG
jgi:hypothetical protein